MKSNKNKRKEKRIKRTIEKIKISNQYDFVCGCCGLPCVPPIEYCIYCGYPDFVKRHEYEQGYNGM